MRIVITGGTGLIGTALTAALVARGDQVLLYTRKPRPPRAGVFYFEGDPQVVATYAAAIDGADAIINLAGAPIARLWTAAARSTILSSRVKTTEALVGALKQAQRRPKVFLSASAIGLYGADPQGQCDESSPAGYGFLADVCRQWEAAAQPAEAQGVRLVQLRLGVVLAAQGGMLPLVARAAKSFVGGPIGNGEQWISWIHLEDVVRLILFALEHPTLRGPVNVVAINPVRHAQFITQVGRALSRPMWLRLPGWAARLALGDAAREMVLASQQVVPKKALHCGFSYRFVALEAALADLLSPNKTRAASRP